jgi:5,10-methenyltetrahydromethanopterin hydrogenase
MDRLRYLGINLLGARNGSIRDLVSEVPATVVARLLGYSDQVTHLHAAAAAAPMARYASTRRQGV